MNMFLTGLLALALTCCGPSSPAGDTTLVVSSDPELRSEVAELLPALVERSGLTLREPVRVERRSRAQLERYLVAKLDEDMPPERERQMVRSYALLGLVPPDLELREMLLSVYTEQVAGFYDPDSTALFVLDDMPPESLRPLLVHELVHAVQDQVANLDSLTSETRGNDRLVAAQAAIEGHATLVMFEHMTAETEGEGVDLSEVPDFGARMRPALEAMRSQYPALAGAPAVIRESILFPYLEGTDFVHSLWSAREARPAPFGEDLPLSTEQILHPERFLGTDGGRDEPTRLEVTVEGSRELYSDGLGEFETRLLLEALVGAEAAGAATGWDGDRFVLVAPEGEDAPADGGASGDGGAAGAGNAAGDGPGGAGRDALVWATIWDDEGSRDRFIEVLQDGLDRLPEDARLERLDLEGRPGVLLRVGDPGPVQVTAASGSGG